MGTHHFALSGEQDQVAGNSQLDVVPPVIITVVSPDGHFDGGKRKGWRNRGVVEAVADPSSGEILGWSRGEVAPLQMPLA